MRNAQRFSRRPALTRGVVTACLALLLAQATAGAAPVARGAEHDGAKEADSARMAELEATLVRLRRLGAHDSTDNALRAQWETAVLEYAALSKTRGGDRAQTPSAGDEAGAVHAPESAPPSPPDCTAATPVTFTNSTRVFITATGTPTVTSTLVVSGAGPYLYDVDVQTFITHTFNADLDVTITSPAGTVVTLTTDNGNFFDDVFDGTVWDDDADPDGVAPFSTVAETEGTNANSASDHPYANLTVATPLAPEEPLGAFIGENPNGTWTLTINDDSSGDGGTLDGWSLMLSTLPSAPAATTATGSNTTPVAISAVGNPTVTSTITIATPGTSILDVNVTTAITHTFTKELQITLTHGSTTVTLASNPINPVTLTGNLDNIYNGTTWDDDANPGGQVPYTSNSGLATDHPYANDVVVPLLAPAEALAAFVGEDPNGVWTLTIGDRFNGDGGSLDSWSLDITTASCEQTTTDLGTTNTASPMVVGPGQNVTYTVTTTNNGAVTPGTITVTDTLPANAAFVSATASAGGSVVQTVPAGSMGGTLVYSYPGVATGNGVTLTVVVAVPAGAPDGTLVTNTATGASDLVDDAPGNDSATVSATVQRSADISLTIADSPDPAGTGGQITYTLTATNNGPDTPGSITITDALPAGVTFVSAAGGTANVPDPAPGSTSGVVMHSFDSGIGPGQSVVLTVVVGVPVATADGTTITNMASAASNVADPTPGNNTASATTTVVRSSVDLSVTETDSPDPITTGATITYTLAVANAGPDTATDVVVADTLPASLTFVNATSPGATQGESGDARTFTYSTLAPGASATITIQATVSCALADGATIENTATVTSPETDTNAANNTTTATTTAANPAPTVTCPANIVAGATTTQGANVSYATPAATDGCAGATVACLPASGSLFPVGTTTVTCTATDSGGGTGTCSFTVTVATALPSCFVDDATGDTLSIMTDSSSPLYRKWQYHVAATGEVFRGSAESLVYYPGRSLLAYDHDSARVRMDLSVNYVSRTAMATVRTLGAGGRTFTLRDRNILNNPQCQQ